MRLHANIRVVIDVNIWVSFAIAKGIKSRFEEILQNPQIQIISSVELIDELTRVLNYPKILKLTASLQNFSPDIFISMHKSSVTLVKQKKIISVSPDPKDNYLLSIAHSGKAHYLITGDKPHLLSLKRYKSIQIVSFSEFCNIKL